MSAAASIPARAHAGHARPGLLLFAIVALLAAAAVVVLVWSQRRHAPLTVSGFIEAHDIRLGSRVGGRVREVLAVEGQAVKPGDVLVTLDPFDLESRLADARAGLAAAKAEHEKLLAGFRPEEIEQVRAERDRFKAILDRLLAGFRPLELEILQDKLDSAEADLRKAQFDFERKKALFDKGDATPDEMTQATRDLESTQARVAQAGDELALAREGTRPEELAEARAQLARAAAALALQEKGFRSEDIAAAEARVHSAEAQVVMIQEQLDELRVVAPIDALIESIELRPGDIVAASAPVISLIDRSELWVRAYVPENRLDLKLGQKLMVRVDSFPDRQFAGRVTFVARQAEFVPSNVQTPEERSKQVFRIKVELEEGREELRPGMAADVIFEP